MQRNLILLAMLLEKITQWTVTLIKFTKNVIKLEQE